MTLPPSNPFSRRENDDYCGYTIDESFGIWKDNALLFQALTQQEALEWIERQPLLAARVAAAAALVKRPPVPHIKEYRVPAQGNDLHNIVTRWLGYGGQAPSDCELASLITDYVENLEDSIAGEDAAVLREAASRLCPTTGV